MRQHKRREEAAKHGAVKARLPGTAHKDALSCMLALWKEAPTCVAGPAIHFTRSHHAKCVHHAPADSQATCPPRKKKFHSPTPWYIIDRHALLRHLVYFGLRLGTLLACTFCRQRLQY